MQRMAIDTKEGNPENSWKLERVHGLKFILYASVITLQQNQEA